MGSTNFTPPLKKIWRLCMTGSLFGLVVDKIGTLIFKNILEGKLVLFAVN
jgi:hypothetical protein